ncbi:HEAT repeat domain-containing protein [Calothrix sp. PCC 6303]|uniref:HEAT repeat domain-containing protein n=1 Tax=Calothrix sp. PCC 6303 TaxID=1170562 RepID=UPI0002A0335E|nr:HEAT repeat domain-containing protein [Calothrix sp. PCC 6303]AFZ03849.1 PBS lyase HEAT domain protein repeat-containing protein [Calothrix sp. PCC 6303]
MNNTINSQNSQLSADETDALLEVVNTQLDDKTFNIDDQKILKQMVESLGDGRGMIRFSFAEALGDIGKPATPFLIAALSQHINVAVRRASAKTLTLIADPKAVPTLVDSLLYDRDTVVKGSVVGALAKTGETSVPALLQIIASNEYPESSKGLATWALAFVGLGAKEYVYKAIHSKSPEVRAAVIGSIATITQENPEANAVAILLEAINDPVSFVRCEATTALSNIKYTPAVPKLIDLLANHADWKTRKAAALALMKIGETAAIQPLQAALVKEKEAPVVAAIKSAIAQLDKLVITDDW